MRRASVPKGTRYYVQCMTRYGEVVFIKARVQNPTEAQAYAHTVRSVLLVLDIHTEAEQKAHRAHISPSLLATPNYR